MKFDSIFAFANNGEPTGKPKAPQQFCPIFDNEAEAVEAATCEVADTDVEDVVVVSKSAEDRRVTVVCGTKGIYVVIPCIGALTGYYEVVAGRLNTRVDTEERRITLAQLLYSIEGRECYKGLPLSDRQFSNTLTIDITSDGHFYDRHRNGYRPIQHVPKKKGMNYDKYKVAIALHNESAQPAHHLVYAAFNGMSLDLMKILTNKESDWCEWYTTSDNCDIAAARELRKRGKGALWGIDHINQHTHDNSIVNLQLCTDNANRVLAKLRKSNFKVLALDED